MGGEGFVKEEHLPCLLICNSGDMETFLVCDILLFSTSARFARVDVNSDATAPPSGQEWKHSKKPRSDELHFFINIRGEGETDPQSRTSADPVTSRSADNRGAVLGKQILSLRGV
ncbi:hypothetical protein F2P79_014214 [Pimephales promelas]|nr:hypothetical protein F2P79_014214 [Pimephales promelas]